MRFAGSILVVMCACGLLCAQGSTLASQTSSSQITHSMAMIGSLPDAPEPNSSELAPMQKMKGMIKTQVNHAIDSNGCPSVYEWRPLTTQEKFGVFVRSTYSPYTFINAAVSQATDPLVGTHLREDGYESGFRGIAQRYGIELSTNETDVFFQRFLFPTLLKQDPRYFRNPDLPVPSRILYSVSRVLITRNDDGRDALNVSRVLGGGASRAVADLYVPGERQGIGAIASSVGINMLQDAGMNLLREFWPDLRQKFLHR